MILSFKRQCIEYYVNIWAICDYLHTNINPTQFASPGNVSLCKVLVVQSKQNICFLFFLVIYLLAIVFQPLLDLMTKWKVGSVGGKPIQANERAKGEKTDCQINKAVS